MERRAAGKALGRPRKRPAGAKRPSGPSGTPGAYQKLKEKLRVMTQRYDEERTGRENALQSSTRADAEMKVLHQAIERLNAAWEKKLANFPLEILAEESLQKIGQEMKMKGINIYPNSCARCNSDRWQAMQDADAAAH